MFENKVLRKIFGPKRDKVTGELNDLYSSPNISGDQAKSNEMGGACSIYGERKGAHRVLVGKPEGSRPLGRPRHRSEDSIKMDLPGSEMGDMDWIDLVQNGECYRLL